MRGKADIRECLDDWVGITPAYAGKRVRMRMRSPVMTGSPPRMRGKAFAIWILPFPQRITPAYAGKRATRRADFFRRRDHPRVCGEKSFLMNSSRKKSGSPPRMRGKVPSMLPDTPFSGITPAYAGKSQRDRTGRQWLQDHPRVCGEKASLVAWWENNSGSPPRMRGKAYGIGTSNIDPGITPAYAGKRLARTIIASRP